ncbi:putative membrane protein mmpS3 [Mycobacterium xenopi 4042]|uniref:Putative membrane protein mmpS3 n=1 Tax=Mycobacterium xenopi 4042 TaxID=1299334 RepID=X8DD72_MYCXE|nr:putative membrane protein mmpS3 [Mycobacterium xenopi 4042]
MPVDLGLYDYDSYDEPAAQDQGRPPRWPWVVGVAAIVAAIALVVSVSLLFARTGTTKLATPSTAPTSTPPMQDEIIATTPPPALPPPPPPRETVTVTTTAPPRPAAPPPRLRHHRRQRLRRRQRHPRPLPTANHDTGRPAAGHLFGDRHQGALRHHHRDLHRRVRAAAHSAQRLHPVDADSHTDLAVGGRLGGGV